MEQIGKKRIYETLAKRFGHTEFRPLQYQLIRHTLAGGNRIAVMGTGAGKSLCYLLPAVLLSGTTLVVSPLISLMRDQHRRSRRAGMRSVLLGEAKGGGRLRNADIVFTSPERLFTGRARRLLSALRINHLVIDEAHCVETWGSLFRPYFGLLADAVRLFGGERVSLFTASAGKERIRSLLQHLEIKKADVFRSSPDRPEIAWHVMKSSLPAAVLVQLLARRRGRALVYCATRRQSEERASFLRRVGFKAGSYHAGLPPEERCAIESRYRNGALRVLCATSAFGMGVDIPSIRTVVHLDRPRCLDSYYQESGRAGRDRKKALALLVLPNGNEVVREDTVWLFLKRILPSLPGQGIAEGGFLRLLDRLGDGFHEGSALYAALLSSGVYVRRAAEKGALVYRAKRPEYLLRSARLRFSFLEKSSRRAVGRYLRSTMCRREALLSGYDAVLQACGGCDICGSEYTPLLKEISLRVEHLAALRRKIIRYPLYQANRIIGKAGLGRRERALVEQLFFRNSQAL